MIKTAPPQQAVDEPALVARALHEPAAFARLYDHYFLLVHKYVLYRVRDAQAADDLASQIFERVLNDLGKYRAGHAPFGAWLFGIARHVVGDHFRALKRQRWLPFDSLRHVPSQNQAPEERAVQSELGERLLAALEQLSERERDLISLKFAAGLNNRQIAALTGLRETNVGIIFYRAMQHLRVVLNQEEIKHD
jgi:RNA polymerase sigma-70 factor (ECF subfamily)